MGFRFYFSDIGETGAWGWPKKKLAKNEYNYQISALMAEQEPFDVYLIDGRYRIACVCAAFLHAIKYSKGSSARLKRVRVGIHDNVETRSKNMGLQVEDGQP